MAAGFSFISPGATDEGQLLEPNAAARRRKVLEALALQAGDTSPIQSPWQGVAKIAQGGLAGYEMGALDKKEEEARKAASADSRSLLGGIGAPPAASPADQVSSALTTPPATAPTFTMAGGPMGDYLAQTRARESGNDPNAKNPNSSATGIDQFTDQTWAGLMRKYPQLGLTANGRTDPQQSTRAMEAFTRDNANALTAKGLPINPTNLYGSHFLGEAGGPRFIAGAMQSPDAPAVSFVSPGAASANRSVFYNKDGTPKTAGQVYAWMGGTRPNSAPAPALPGGRGAVSSALADLPAEGAQPTSFTIPGQPAPQATVAAAMVTPERLVMAQRVLNNPYATPGDRSVAQAMVQRALKDQEPKTASVAPGGRLVDERTGRVLYEAPQKDDPTSEQRNFNEWRKDNPTGSFQQFLDKQRMPLTPTIVAPGNTVLPPGEFSAPSFVAPDPKGAEQAARQGREEVGNLRKEVHTLPSYKNYAQAHPVYQGMVETADRNTKASDLNLVYGLGKIMDPGSVVREGEIQMAQDTQGLGDRLNGMIKGIMGGARLSPEARKQILTEAYGRMQSYESSYNQDAQGYRAIVERGKMNPADVLPNFGPVKPYEGGAGAEAKPSAAAPPAGTKVIGGKTYARGADGHWYEAQ